MSLVSTFTLCAHIYILSHAQVKFAMENFLARHFLTKHHELSARSECGACGEMRNDSFRLQGHTDTMSTLPYSSDETTDLEYCCADTMRRVFQAKALGWKNGWHSESSSPQQLLSVALRAVDVCIKKRREFEWAQTCIGKLTALPDKGSTNGLGDFLGDEEIKRVMSEHCEFGPRFGMYTEAGLCVRIDFIDPASVQEETKRCFEHICSRVDLLENQPSCAVTGALDVEADISSSVKEVAAKKAAKRDAKKAVKKKKKAAMKDAKKAVAKNVMTEDGGATTNEKGAMVMRMSVHPCAAEGDRETQTAMPCLTSEHWKTLAICFSSPSCDFAIEVHAEDMKAELCDILTVGGGGGDLSEAGRTTAAATAVVAAGRERHVWLSNKLGGTHNQCLYVFDIVPSALDLGERAIVETGLAFAPTSYCLDQPTNDASPPGPCGCTTAASSAAAVGTATVTAEAADDNLVALGVWKATRETGKVVDRMDFYCYQVNGKLELAIARGPRLAVEIAVTGDTLNVSGGSVITEIALEGQDPYLLGMTEAQTSRWRGGADADAGGADFSETRKGEEDEVEKVPVFKSNFKFSRSGNTLQAVRSGKWRLRTHDENGMPMFPDGGCGKQEMRLVMKTWGTAMPDIFKARCQHRIYNKDFDLFQCAVDMHDADFCGKVPVEVPIVIVYKADGLTWDHSFREHKINGEAHCAVDHIAKEVAYFDSMGMPYAVVVGITTHDGIFMNLVYGVEADERAPNRVATHTLVYYLCDRIEGVIQLDQNGEVVVRADYDSKSVRMAESESQSQSQSTQGVLINPKDRFSFTSALLSVCERCTPSSLSSPPQLRESETTLGASVDDITKRLFSTKHQKGELAYTGELCKYWPSQFEVASPRTLNIECGGQEKVQRAIDAAAEQLENATRMAREHGSGMRSLRQQFTRLQRNFELELKSWSARSNDRFLELDTKYTAAVEALDVKMKQQQEEFDAALCVQKAKFDEALCVQKAKFDKELCVQKEKLDRAHFVEYLAQRGRHEEEVRAHQQMHVNDTQEMCTMAELIESQKHALAAMEEKLDSMERMRQSPSPPPCPSSCSSSSSCPSPRCAAPPSSELASPPSRERLATLDTEGFLALKEAVEAEATRRLDANQCKVCMANPVQILLVPCGHLAICSDCAERMRFDKGGRYCPMCREVVTSTMNVKLA